MRQYQNNTRSLILLHLGFKHAPSMYLWATILFFYYDFVDGCSATTYGNSSTVYLQIFKIFITFFRILLSAKKIVTNGIEKQRNFFI